MDVTIHTEYKSFTFLFYRLYNTLHNLHHRWLVDQIQEAYVRGCSVAR